MTNVRRTGAVSAAALSGLALTLGLAHAVAPDWAARAGLDVWNLEELRDDFRANSEEWDELVEKEQRLHRECEATGSVAARMVEGELTLAEAADLLQPILRERPGFESTWRYDYRVPDFRRGCARYAIQRTVRDVAPDRRAELEDRLEAEYAAMK